MLEIYIILGIAGVVIYLMYRNNKKAKEEIKSREL